MLVSFSPDPAVAERQMHAVIYYLTAFGYIDGDFDHAEKKFIQEHIAALVRSRAEGAMGAGADPAALADVVARWTQHFHEVLDEVDAGIQEHFDEVVADGESSKGFVLAKLKLRCYELFRQFDESDRRMLLAAATELIEADGVVHPNEEKFRRELTELLGAPVELDELDVEAVADTGLVVGSAERIAPAAADHPFFSGFEWDYVRDPKVFLEQASADVDVLKRTMETLRAQREKGRGALSGKATLADLAPGTNVLDGHLYAVTPEPGRAYELLVLGDLHGCYSCLKAALLQADFFTKVQRYHDDPINNPRMMLVLLGDYIDRGRFSYNGVLRTVLQIYLRVPEHVFVLRGNHEFYVELNGRIYGGVKPAEAINSLEGLAPVEVFKTYKQLFESLPNVLFFDKTMFVHAGIPRDDLVQSKVTSLASLNDPEMRFQMLWSDPSEADVIPLELQKENARFPFGRKQFKSFMQRLGATTLVRGHERVIEGFKAVYDDGEHHLLNLFSAGGATNRDLPEKSSYREVTPMALRIEHKDGLSKMTPFVIEYERFNDASTNKFFA